MELFPVRIPISSRRAALTDYHHTVRVQDVQHYLRPVRMRGPLISKYVAPHISGDAEQLIIDFEFQSLVISVSVVELTVQTVSLTTLMAGYVPASYGALKFPHRVSYGLC